MSMLALAGLLVLNLVIAVLNGYSAGRGWDAARAAGAGARLVVWSTAVMSACGFTYVYLALAAWGAMVAGKLTPEAVQALLSLGYLAIILPVLGSGMVLWVESVRRAWRTKAFGDMLVGGYNTYAQLSNTLHAMRDIPGAWEVVASFFGEKGKSRARDKDQGTVLLLAVVAAGAGILTTYALVSAGRRHEAARLYAAAREARPMAGARA